MTISGELGKIGFDKVVLYSIPVLILDMGYLDNLDNVFVRAQTQFGIWYPYVLNGKNVISIKIVDDNIFAEMKITFQNDETGYVNQGCHISLTVTHMKGTNLIPAEKAEYDDLIYSLPQYLLEKYQIIADFSHCKLDKAEIATNLLPGSKYTDYQKPLQLLTSYLGARYPVQNFETGLANLDGSKTRTIETFLNGNNSIEISFYDKAKQLQKKRRLPNDIDKSQCIIRFEFRLISKKNTQIVKWIGTNNWWEITQYDVVNAFNLLWNYFFFNRYETWYKQSKKYITKIFRKYRGDKRWAIKLINEIHNRHDRNGMPFILGREQIVEVIEETKKTDRHYSDKLKTLERNKAADDVLWDGNYGRMLEILSLVEENISSSLVPD